MNTRKQEVLQHWRTWNAPPSHSFNLALDLTKPLDAAIAQMNDEFCCFLGRKGFTVWDRQHMRALSVTDVQHWTADRIIDGVPLFNKWRAHPYCHKYHQVDYLPGIDIPGIFNYWTGWGVLPYSGKTEMEKTTIWQQYIEPWVYHIHHVLCSGNEEHSTYMLNWLAHMFQFPMEKPGVGIILRSDKQGAGKGTLYKFLENMLGHRNVMMVNSMRKLVGGFNMHIEHAFLIFMDEASWGGNRMDNGELLSMVTEKTLPIEGKGVDMRSVKSYHRFLLATNNDWPVPIVSTDRRWFVPAIDESYVGNMGYFSALNDLANNVDCAAAFVDYLLDRDLSGFNIRKVPGSNGKDALKLETAFRENPFDIFMLETAMSNTALQPKTTVTVGIVLDAYKEFLDRNHVLRMRISKDPNIVSLGMQLKAFGLQSAFNQGKRVWHIPGEDDLKQLVAASLNINPDILM